MEGIGETEGWSVDKVWMKERLYEGKMEELYLDFRGAVFCYAHRASSQSPIISGWYLDLVLRPDN